MDRIPLRQADALAKAVTRVPARPRRDWDRLVLGPWTAYPLVLILLFLIFYLTLEGANLPSRLLEQGLNALGRQLAVWLSWLPEPLASLLVDGIYGTAAKVVAVMLPPMAIFFPLFTLLEDLGFLPRAAVLMDRPFAWVGSCGRQGLCMCMGLGCNAVGVTGCRIIPNSRERLAAILTNSLIPCNGRFPTLILLSGLMLGRSGQMPALAAAGVLTLLLALSFAGTLGLTGLLRRTLLRGEGSPFVLELPPFRRPRLAQLLLRSLADRTLRVLGRALTVAAPAGAIIWMLGVLRPGGMPLLFRLAQALDPTARVFGLTGPLLLAFLLSFPANELLLPLWILILQTGAPYSGFQGLAPCTADALHAGVMAAAELGTEETACFLVRHGASAALALRAAVFTLFHWPCSTTLLTVRRETGSWGWTLLAAALPTALGAALCLLLRWI